MLHCKQNNEQPQHLSDREKSNIKQLAEMYDQAKKGGLEFDEFLGLMKAVIGLNNLNDVEEEDIPESGRVNVLFLKFLYDGMDLKETNNVSIDEICQCVVAIKEKDYRYITKMVFRGCDFERKKKISAEDIQNAIQNADKDGGQNAFSTKEFDDKCKAVFGEKKKFLEYFEFYKLVTGENIDSNTDPYDGELEKQSKCCLLL